MPGTKWKRSLKHPRMYEALRRQGYSKQTAARISNSRTKGRTVKQARARRRSSA